MDTNIIIFQIIVLVMSAAIHEYSHAWAADQQGDHTAREMGRLSINPLRHLDFFGSFFLPLLLIIFNTPIIFGYAKPVPINPYNLRESKWGMAKVAAAGPLANFTLALVFGLILRYLPMSLSGLTVPLAVIVYINLILMIFNLVPIPPLDGSKVILPFLPYHLQEKYMRLEPYGMMLVIFFMLMGLQFVWLAVGILFRLIVGG